MESLRRDRSSSSDQAVQAKERSSAAPGKGGDAAESARADGALETGASGDSGGEARAGAWEADSSLMAAMGLGEEGSAGGAAGGARAKGAGKAKGPKKRTPQGPAEGAAEGGGPASGGARDGGGSVQREATVGGAPVGGLDMHGAAAAGVSGSGGALPHLDAIQHSFGRHDVSGVSAHTDGAAAKATSALGAEAYATGNSVAFSSSAPSLHTAAHEAAHVVQQRAGVHLKGGVGEVGDRYEQHADAVADRVVQGKSAEGLLDQMAPAGSGGGGDVQKKALQFDIKSELRDAMDGWGTDEEAIFRRCERATAAEAQAVLADAGLMDRIRGELDQADMSRVLDGLRAPLADKLRLAMRGWGTDEDYIHRSLANATPAELAAIAADDALVRQLEGELSGDDLKQVLDKLNVPLARKLRFAVRGWGTDEEYLFRLIEQASGADAVALANDAATVALVDADLSGADLHRWRGTLAKKVYQAGNALLAFRMIRGVERAKRAERLRWVGDLSIQRALLDNVIASGGGGDVATVVDAFSSYWDVDMSESGGTWGIPQLQTAHTQCKNLPEQDVRSGVWKRFVAIAGSGGSMSSGGEFQIGAAASGNQPYGVGTTLTRPTAAAATEIFVQDPAVFATGATIAVERGTGNADVAQISAVDAAAKKYTLATGLAHAHGGGAAVTPDDATAVRQVDWVSAVVRHEIAHSVETAMNGVTSFTQGLGGWWSGDSFDSWANAMGTPWATNDGSAISADEQKQIKDHITDQMKVRGESGQAIQTGLAADHAIVKYLNKGVPVIEAAKPCVAVGQRYWQNPESVWSNGGKRFAINFYYKNFQYYNEVVHAQRVRSYSIFAPAEFFAEVYTVFYEQAGSVPDADLGALVPNAGWRDWIRTNVHNRGLTPGGGGGGGGGGPSLPSATVGIAAGNPGA